MIYSLESNSSNITNLLFPAKLNSAFKENFMGSLINVYSLISTAMKENRTDVFLKFVLKTNFVKIYYQYNRRFFDL